MSSFAAFNDDINEDLLDEPEDDRFDEEDDYDEYDGEDDTGA